MSVQRHFFQPVGKHSSSTHCRETSPAVISGFFIYYAVSYYIKNCLLAFFFLKCILLFFFRSFLASSLPASGSFPQWEDNPESSRGSFWSPPHLSKLIHTNTNIGPRGFSGNFCLRFPMDWLWSGEGHGYFLISEGTAAFPRVVFHEHKSWLNWQRHKTRLGDWPDLLM